MGNHLITNNGLLDESKPVGQYIKNWALQNYQVNKNEAANDEPMFRDSLKKRGCCSNNSAMGIDIPYMTTTGKVGIFNLRMQIFPTNAPISASTCTLSYTSSTGQNTTRDYSYRTDPTSSKSINNPDGGCEMLYKGHNNSLSKQLQKNRKKYLPSYYESSHGPISNSDLRGENNPFKDLSCVNSLYNLYKNELGLVDSLKNESIPTSIDKYAQSVDPRCMNTAGVGAWIEKYEYTDKPICVNNINIGSMSASEKGLININQSCTIQQEEHKNSINSSVAASNLASANAASARITASSSALAASSSALAAASSSALAAASAPKASVTASTPVTASLSASLSASSSRPPVSASSTSAPVTASATTPVTTSTRISSLISTVKSAPKIYIGIGGCICCIFVLILLILMLE
jgi:hypothetical protein